MFRVHRSRIASVCLVIAGLLMLACNSSQRQPAQDQTLVGAGSTFINPVMTHWISGFQDTHSGAQISYQSIGSGGGIQLVQQGAVDFGATDAGLNDEKLKEMPPLVQIPVSGGAVCVSYNLPELKSPLELSGTTVAGIYLGQIRSWQDAAIKKDNEGVSLPDRPIAVVHRSDGSGTTSIFTSYLAKTSQDWSKLAGHGISVNWPVGTGGRGNEGVTAAVKRTEGGIGYVELAYAKANNLAVAQVRNQAGSWIAPTAAGATAAIEAFQRELANDLRTPVVDPPANAPDAYPISGLTCLLVPKQAKDEATQQILKEFVQYIITEGQASAQGLEYATLPLSVAAQDQRLLGEIRGGQQSEASDK